MVAKAKAEAQDGKRIIANTLCSLLTGRQRTRNCAEVWRLNASSSARVTGFESPATAFALHDSGFFDSDLFLPGAAGLVAPEDLEFAEFGAGVAGAATARAAGKERMK
jgi:hypothetical protein